MLAGRDGGAAAGDRTGSDVLDGSAEPRISARDSIARMQVIDAVCESIATGNAALP